MTLYEAEALVSQARAAGQKIVFTSGAFQPLDAAGIRHLQQVSQLGDMLVVGVDDADQAAVLSSLKCVDACFVLNGAGVEGALSALRPEVYVHSGEASPAVPAQPSRPPRVGAGLQRAASPPRPETAAPVRAMGDIQGSAGRSRRRPGRRRWRRQVRSLWHSRSQVVLAVASLAVLALVAYFTVEFGHISGWPSLFPDGGLTTLQRHR